MAKLGSGQRLKISAENFFQGVMGSFKPEDIQDLKAIAVSSDNCTVYPSILETLSMSRMQHVTFKLVDGHFTYHGRPYRELRSTRGPAPMAATVSPEIPLLQNDFRPSSIGVHKGEPLVTITEALDHLMVRSDLQYEGIIYPFELYLTTICYIDLLWTAPCTHSSDQPLDVQKYPEITWTSLAQRFAESRRAIAMTRGSPTAQLFCCDVGRSMQVLVMQHDCCLNCAVEQAVDLGLGFVIICQ